MYYAIKDCKIKWYHNNNILFVSTGFSLDH